MRTLWERGPVLVNLCQFRFHADRSYDGRIVIWNSGSSTSFVSEQLLAGDYEEKSSHSLLATNKSTACSASPRPEQARKSRVRDRGEILTGPAFSGEAERSNLCT
jgi:hypothetical protein